ncbi:MAG TPA: hypothetical protein VKI45_04485 [Allosphingosinicella sp.]|nr:hypothetical protein [Allosphingosinicella sp.]
MEVFVPDRSPAEVAALIRTLRALGLGGRDAAYLASVAPPAEAGPERTRYREEFEFMVPPHARAPARTALGLG